MPAGDTSIPQGLIEALRDSRHVLVLTGAGISAESGVPTFRDAQDGLWARYDPMDLATPDAFERDPELVWRWYRWRRELVAGVKPNAGHRAVAALAHRVPKLTLVTQNVDGLHQLAGSRDVIEYHGNLFRDICSNACGEQPATAGANELPRCPACNALLRPGVVWFGEAIPSVAMAAADSAAGSCDVVLTIGTSSHVWPAAGLAEAARRNGACIAEVNPGETGVSEQCDYRIRAAAGSAVPKLVDSLAGRYAPPSD